MAHSTLPWLGTVHSLTAVGVNMAHSTLPWLGTVHSLTAVGVNMAHSARAGVPFEKGCALAHVQMHPTPE